MSRWEILKVKTTYGKYNTEGETVLLQLEAELNQKRKHLACFVFSPHIRSVIFRNNWGITETFPSKKRWIHRSVPSKELAPDLIIYQQFPSASSNLFFYDLKYVLRSENSFYRFTLLALNLISVHFHVLKKIWQKWKVDICFITVCNHVWKTELEQFLLSNLIWSSK